MPKSKPINQADRLRFERLIDLGCICCWKMEVVYGYSRPEIHHLVEGYRLGHQYTIPLCSWHHRGEPMELDMPKSHAEMLFGYNLHDNKKGFIREFGTERQLLEEVNKWLEGESPQEIKGPQQNESSLPF